MNKLEIKRFNWTLNIPANWQELSERQFISIMEIILGPHSQAAQELLILKLLFNIKEWHFRRIWQFIHLKPDELLALRQGLTQWCFEPFKMADWKLKHLAKLPAHKEGISRWSFGLFCYADTYYTKWAQTQDIGMLNKLMACIYSADLANLTQIIDRHSHFEQIQLSTKVSIAINFEHLRSSLTSTFPQVFSVASENGRQPNKYGWAAVLDELAGTKFGSHAETEADNVMKIFIHLERLQEKAAEKTND